MHGMFNDSIAKFCHCLCKCSYSLMSVDCQMKWMPIIVGLQLRNIHHTQLLVYITHSKYRQITASDICYVTQWFWYRKIQQMSAVKSPLRYRFSRGRPPPENSSLSRLNLPLVMWNYRRWSQCIYPRYNVQPRIKPIPKRYWLFWILAKLAVPLSCSVNGKGISFFSNTPSTVQFVSIEPAKKLNHIF